MEDRTGILVADEQGSLHRLGAMLSRLGYEPILVTDGEEVLARVKEHSPGVVLLGKLASGPDSLEIARRLKKDASTAAIPIVMLSAREEAQQRTRALDAGVDDFLVCPVDEAELRARVHSQLRARAHDDYLRDHQQQLETEVALRTKDLSGALEKLKMASLDTVYRLSRAAEYKDDDTGAHVQRMSHYASTIARGMQLDDEFVERILWASPMHDIGKIGIPDSILQKPGKLDPEEWAVMKRHTDIGAEILRDAIPDFVKLAGEIALTHHERWDGTGYPQGLKGSGIPTAGRIVALADVFDALMSERPYKAAFHLAEAMEIIRDGRGRHFDPDVVDSFLGAEHEITAELKWWRFLESDSPSEDPDLPGLFDQLEEG